MSRPVFKTLPAGCHIIGEGKPPAKRNSSPATRTEAPKTPEPSPEPAASPRRAVNTPEPAKGKPGFAIATGYGGRLVTFNATPAQLETLRQAALRAGLADYSA